MFDATRSPRPYWQRIATGLALIVLILVVAWAIWTKELHHHISSFHIHQSLPTLIRAPGSS